MTVRADDIALGDLGKDSVDTCAPNHERDPHHLRRWVAVIEVHRALGEPPTAICTWNRSKLVEDFFVIAPADSTLRSLGRLRWRSQCKPFPMARPASESVAIRADHVALGGLNKKLRAIL
jgi:hypothetical protein